MNVLLAHRSIRFQLADCAELNALIANDEIEMISHLPEGNALRWRIVVLGAGAERSQLICEGADITLQVTIEDLEQLNEEPLAGIRVTQEGDGEPLIAHLDVDPDKNPLKYV